MRIFRRSLATLICVLMMFPLANTVLTGNAAYAETESHVHNETEPFSLTATAVKNTVFLNAGKGTVSTSSVTLKEDGTLPALPIPTRTGWNFVGWYTGKVTENYWGDEEGETLEGLQQKYPAWSTEQCKLRTFTWIIESEGKKVETGTKLSPEITTLYAMYEPTTVTVVWHYNGWRNSDGIFLTGRPQYGSPLTPANLTTAAFNWEGHIFEGWYTAPEGGEKWEFHNVNDYQCSEKTLTGDLDLYAHWSGGASAKALRLTPSSQAAEPGSEFTISATYTPYDANSPKITWTSDSDLITVKSVNGLKVTLAVSPNADVINTNKQVTITARTEDGVTASTVITICHNWNNGRTVKWPSCTDGGTVRYTCRDCGKTRDVILPADGHRFTYTETPPTCTEEGHTDLYCIICGMTEHEINAAALGHSWSVRQIASCSGTVTTSTCKTCGLTEVNSDVNAAEHDWETTPTIDKAPTCFTDGTLSYHCKNCGLTRNSAVIPADASLHKWGSWNVTVKATETETGEETHVCVTCGTKEKRTLPALGVTAAETTPDATHGQAPEEVPEEAPVQTPDTTKETIPAQDSATTSAQDKTDAAQQPEENAGQEAGTVSDQATQADSEQMPPEVTGQNSEVTLAQTAKETVSQDSGTTSVQTTENADADEPKVLNGAGGIGIALCALVLALSGGSIGFAATRKKKASK